MISRLVIAAALVSSICGCANSLLYDESRDKQGQAAVKAVEEAHLTSTVEAMNPAFADMAAREEASARARAEQLFEWEKARVSQTNTLNDSSLNEHQVDGLATSVTKRLKKLGLDDANPDALKKLAQTPGLLRTRQIEFDVSRSSFLGAYGVQFDDCTQVHFASSDPNTKSKILSDKMLKRINPESQVGAKGEFQSLVETCSAMDALRDGWIGMFKGDIRKLAHDVTAQSKVTAEYEAAKQEIAAKIAAAKEAAKPAIRAADPGKPRAEVVKAKADELLGLVNEARTSINDLAGAEVFAEDKLADLEAIVNGIAGSPPDGKVTLTENQQITIGTLRGVIELGDEAKTLYADAAKPRLVPLLAAIDFQKLVLEKIEDVRKVDQKRAGLVAAQLQAALDESAALAGVLNTIQTNGWGNKSLADLDRTLTKDNKRLFYEMLGTYGDGVREARISQVVYAARAEGALYERNAVDSRYAAMQWDGLMDMCAKVLADYHAAGIKPDDLAEFFKALGLVVVGVGVAQ